MRVQRIDVTQFTNMTEHNILNALSDIYYKDVLDKGYRKYSQDLSEKLDSNFIKFKGLKYFDKVEAIRSYFYPIIGKAIEVEMPDIFKSKMIDEIMLATKGVVIVFMNGGFHNIWLGLSRMAESKDFHSKDNISALTKALEVINNYNYEGCSVDIFREFSADEIDVLRG